MPYPKISIVFKSAAASAIERSDRGIVALILKDAAAQKGNLVLQSVTDIPAGLSTYNKNQLSLAFMGGSKAPLRVLAVVQDSALADYSTSMSYLETVPFDVLAVPGIASADATTVASWVKSCRDSKNKKFIAVLPSTAGDHEGIVNFATDNIIVGATTYAAKDYAARIAGIIAGTPLTSSCTFFPLPEVTDVPHLINTDVDAAIDAGKLILVNDGRQVKIARGVNSLQTLTTDKTAVFKKIKIVSILDMIYQDIKHTVEDNYIGKITNDYDHRCILISAIKGYFEGLELDGLLAKGTSVVEIDVAAQKVFLTSLGIDTSNMKDSKVKTYEYTGDKVFLSTNIKPLDVMEDINLIVNL